VDVATEEVCFGVVTNIDFFFAEYDSFSRISAMTSSPARTR
jgi:hypothetical protein